MKIADPNRNPHFDHAATYEDVEIIPYVDRVVIVGRKNAAGGTLALTWEQITELACILPSLVNAKVTGTLKAQQ